ncbi:MAG: SDR family NAD(P)-dependent oxidoreductase [Myxococcota bacterium]
MSKTILLTGATDGIGLATAHALAELGHTLLLHGRRQPKVDAVTRAVTEAGGKATGYVADLSRFSDVEALARAVADDHSRIDVLINNAGVFRTNTPTTNDGLDVRFVVNTIAPYLLTQRLLPLLGPSARVVNLSSAAQSPVDLRALAGSVRLGDGPAYAQSKLALTMWSTAMAESVGEDGPLLVAVNPGSMLGTKMVKDAYGVPGGDIGIGADILVRAALSDEFANASGLYFDNDSRRFAAPHPDALDRNKREAVVRALQEVLEKHID